MRLKLGIGNKAASGIRTSSGQYELLDDAEVAVDVSDVGDHLINRKMRAAKDMLDSMSAERFEGAEEEAGHDSALGRVKMRAGILEAVEVLPYVLVRSLPEEKKVLVGQCSSLCGTSLGEEGVEGGINALDDGGIILEKIE